MREDRLGSFGNHKRSPTHDVLAIVADAHY
jgi:hypothetical protein